MNGELQVPDHYNNLIYFISYLSFSLNPFWPNMRTVQIFPSQSNSDSSILTYCNQAQYNKCLIWRFGLSNNQNGYQIIFNMFISQSTLISLFIPQERQLTAMSKCYTQCYRSSALCAISYGPYHMAHMICQGPSVKHH